MSLINKDTHTRVLLKQHVDLSLLKSSLPCWCKDVPVIKEAVTQKHRTWRYHTAVDAAAQMIAQQKPCRPREATMTGQRTSDKNAICGRAQGCTVVHGNTSRPDYHAIQHACQLLQVAWLPEAGKSPRTIQSHCTIAGDAR